MAYAGLVEKLGAIGIRETEANLRNKISRCGFTGAFLIQCLTAMGGEQPSPGRLATVLAVSVVAIALLAGAPWLISVGDRRDALEQVAACQPTESKGCPDKRDVEDARSANADEDSVDVALAQAVLGVVGFVGLIYTVVYARGAWLASERTLKATLEAERRQLRAYVLVKDARAKGLKGTDKLQVQVQISNYGATPARNTRITYSANVYSCDFMPKIEPRRFSDTSVDTVAPGSARSFTIPLADRDALLALLKDPANRLFVWGIVEYDDIYEEPHITTFCLYAVESVRDADGAFAMIAASHSNHDT